MIRGGKARQLLERSLRETLRGARDVLDVGTSQRFAKELRPFEPLFAGMAYIAAGYEPARTYGEYNCDCHQDIHRLTFPDSSFDAVLCIEVIEHVANPFVAAGELYRVLRPGGRLLLTTPFLAQYHGKGTRPDHEGYPDYWRFTHQGLEALLSRFADVRVLPIDGPIEFRLKQFYLEPLLQAPLVRWLVDRIDSPRVGKATTRHLVLAVRR